MTARTLICKTDRGFEGTVCFLTTGRPFHLEKTIEEATVPDASTENSGPFTVAIFFFLVCVVGRGVFFSGTDDLAVGVAYSARWAGKFSVDCLGSGLVGWCEHELFGDAIFYC